MIQISFKSSKFEVVVILKPLKLEECILHFWKYPIFINVVPTSQGHSCILNTYKSILKKAGFILVCLLGVFTFLLIGVSLGLIFGIQNAAMALTSWDHIDEDWSFPKM